MNCETLHELLQERPSINFVNLLRRKETYIVNNYQLPDLWAFTLFDYKLAAVIDETRYNITPGYVVLFPPDTVRSFRSDGPACQRYVHFRFPKNQEKRKFAPIIMNLRKDFLHFTDQFDEMHKLMPVNKLRAEIRFWDILWQFQEYLALTGQKKQAAYSVFHQALQIIEQRLADNTLTISGIAEELKISHNHLTRQFKRNTGKTVAAYIRERRMAQARLLLIHTSEPIKSIAYQVGIPDLHLFNKTVRREFSCSPRALRASTSSKAHND